jgi:nuclear autoantigenic sperm protein
MEHALENHRELAEVHFKLALALEYSEQFEVAMEEVQAAMDCLNKRIKEVEGKTDKEEAELKGFLVELEAKLLDLQTLIEKEDQGEKITTEEQKAPAVVNDISNLVKKATTVSPKKRKQEETEDAEKKLKVE